MDAAGRAEAMVDDVLVERVSGGVAIRRAQLHGVALHEPQQRALAPAHRAVAREQGVDRAFDVERDAPAMAASPVLHGMPRDEVERTRIVAQPRYCRCCGMRDRSRLAPALPTTSSFPRRRESMLLFVLAERVRQWIPAFAVRTWSVRLQRD